MPRRKSILYFVIYADGTTKTVVDFDEIQAEIGYVTMLPCKREIGSVAHAVAVADATSTTTTTTTTSSAATAADIKIRKMYRVLCGDSSALQNLPQNEIGAYVADALGYVSSFYFGLIFGPVIIASKCGETPLKPNEIQIFNACINEIITTAWDKCEEPHTSLKMIQDRLVKSLLSTQKRQPRRRKQQYTTVSPLVKKRQKPNAQE